MATLPDSIPAALFGVEDAEVDGVGSGLWAEAVGAQDRLITPPTDTLRSAPLAEWVAVPQWTVTYTSPDTGGYDPANSQIVAGRITLAMTITRR
ncbi:hypothetical protein ACVV2G_17315 [Streptomyces ziwulingensis]